MSRRTFYTRVRHGLCALYALPDDCFTEFDVVILPEVTLAGQHSTYIRRSSGTFAQAMTHATCSILD